MGGGGGRIGLAAAAVRSLRRRRSALVFTSSHALHLQDTRLCIRPPGNAADFCADQSLIAKSVSESLWIVGGAGGVRTYSQPTMVKAAPPTLLQEVPKAGSGGDSALPTIKGTPRVVFVLGGPGSGKGTQCQKIVDNYGFVHLSAGDLLRAEIQSGTENGAMIQNMIKEGKIVPSEVTVKLLLKAMEESSSDKFLIDGFPRNDENRAVFERLTGIVPEFILFFDCPEDEMERRVLGRNQGRVDDNKETMQKRLQVFVNYSVPVVKYYESMGKVHKIVATGSVDDIYSTIQPLFEPFVQKQSRDERTQTVTQRSGGSPALN